MLSSLCIRFICLGLICICFPACTVNVDTPLSKTFGYSTFENMGEIRRRDVYIGLFIAPEFRNLTLEQKLNNGNFRFPVGEAFASKLVKALSYNFDRIRIMKKPDDFGTPHPDAVMRVELQDADLNVAATPGFATVDASSYLRLAVRAQLTDPTGRVVWVGAATSKGEYSGQTLMQMRYLEAGHYYAIGVDLAVENAVADLVRQVTQSESMQSNLDQWEKERSSGKR
jgi:hypothetical protein